MIIKQYLVKVFPSIAPFENRPAGLFCWYFRPNNNILMQMKAHDCCVLWPQLTEIFYNKQSNLMMHII